MKITNTILVIATSLFAACALQATTPVCEGPCATTTAAQPATTGQTSASEKSAEVAPKAKSHTILVTYYMTSRRCRSCLRIEALTRKTLSDRFALDMADGRIAFRMINIDEPANNHYADDYQISFKTVVISDMVDGKEVRWTRMDKVWENLDDVKGFEDYIAGGINAYKEAK